MQYAPHRYACACVSAPFPRPRAPRRVGLSSARCLCPAASVAYGAVEKMMLWSSPASSDESAASEAASSSEFISDEPPGGFWYRDCWDVLRRRAETAASALSRISRRRRCSRHERTIALEAAPIATRLASMATATTVAELLSMPPTGTPGGGKVGGACGHAASSGGTGQGDGGGRGGG